jgi:hypothetical protein
LIIMTEDLNRHRLLYHFTARETLPSILSSRVLHTRTVIRHARPPRSEVSVLWLTDSADPGRGDDHGLGALDGDADKRAVRFTLSIPDAQHWPQWAARRHVRRRVRRRLDEAGGGLSQRWWVVARAVPEAEWVRVEDLRTGEALWP